MNIEIDMTETRSVF